MKIKKYQAGLFVTVAVIAAFAFIGKSSSVGHDLKKSANLLKSTVTNKKAQAQENFAPPTGRSLKLPILMYHHVGDAPADANATRKDLTVPTQNFAGQMQWLKDSGYNSVTLKDVYLYSQGKFQMPKNPMAITFDDGYADVFQNAIPILQKYGYIGSFAIISQWLGQTMGTNIYASWDAIKSAQSSRMEIVCHTQNHFDGTSPKFDADYIYSNLSGCKNDLSQQGITTNILVYPYGHYNSVYLDQAQKAGFVMGITTHEGDIINLNNLMETPRVRVHGAEDLQRFEDIILDKVRTSTSTPDKISG